MKNNKISRSKIELFISCPRCFWLDVKHGIKRPEEPKGGYIGQKYDPILKKEFDIYREINIKPKEIPENLFLFPHTEKLKKWRGAGIEIKHKSGFIIYGKIDDLLIDENGDLVPFDFKVTLSQEFKIYPSYQRQLEIYGYLLQKTGERVSSKGAFYVIKISFDEEKKIIGEREFHILEPLNLEIYEEVIEKMIETLKSDKAPEPAVDCPYCVWLDNAKKLLF